MSRLTHTFPISLLSLLYTLLFISFTNAQFANLPSTVGQCETLDLSWTPTTGPYTLSVLNSSTSLPLERLLPSAEPSAEWTADLPPGSGALFQLVDGEGLAWNSSVVTVVEGGEGEGCMAQPEVIGQDTLLWNTQSESTMGAASALPTELLSASIPAQSAVAGPSTSIDPDAPPPSESAEFEGPVYSAVAGSGYVQVNPTAAPSAAAVGYGSLQAANSGAARSTFSLQAQGWYTGLLAAVFFLLLA